MGERRAGRSDRAPNPKASVAACLFFILFPIAAVSQTPLVRVLSPSDPVFRQLSADVEDSRRLLSRASDPTEAARRLSVYRYAPARGEDLLFVAARCGVPYETLATVNRIPSGGDLRPGESAFVPATPGLFLPETPATDMERLSAAARGDDEPFAWVILRKDGKALRYRFYPESEFTPTERAFFLNVAFRFPLPSARLTSGFGLRRNPVTGAFKRHEGVDLAAPEGTEVYAVRDGVVIDVGEGHPVYGTYVVIKHEGPWISLYGHLSSVETVLRNEVRSGTIIGRVGSTGQSTGPHLHFELRSNGEAKDPAALIPRGIGR